MTWVGEDPSSNLHKVATVVTPLGGETKLSLGSTKCDHRDGSMQGEKEKAS